MSYDGFFIRDYVGQTINDTTGLSWNNSPDIICGGVPPLPDPFVIINPDNYNKGLPQANFENPLNNNWLYIRGVNPQSVPQTSTVYVYYANISTINWPQTWRTDGVTFAGEMRNWITLNAPAMNDNEGIQGSVIPFGWTPPGVNAKYCLIAWAKNGADQLIPPDLNSIGQIPDIASFVLSNPNIALKMMAEIDATIPTIQNIVSIAGPLSGGLLMIGLQCSNIPTDGYIEFSVPGTDASNTIYFPKSRVVTSNFCMAFQAIYPGGFVSAMNWAYYQGATPPPAGANITPFIAIPVDSENAKEIDSQNSIEVLNYGLPADFAKHNKNTEAESMKVIVIGSMPFNFK